MMARILSAEGLKIKGTWMMALIVIGPLGVVLCMMLDYALRSDYIERTYSDPWTGLIMEAQMLIPLSIAMGATLLASLLAGIEHQQNTWKYILALPLSKFWIYVGKGIQLLLLLLISGILTSLGFVFLWGYNGFEEGIPWLPMFQGTLYPALAAIPVMMIQLWLSMVIHNQALPIATGVLGATVAPAFSDWLPWAYTRKVIPAEEMASDFYANEPEKWIPIALVMGLIILIAGAWHFSRREVK